MAISALEDELKRFGPGSTSEPMSVVNAQAYCKQLALSHYENFPVVTRLLPKYIVQDFYNIYAFCRWADDLGDELGDRDRALQYLGWWRDELAACYADSPRHPVMIALKETVRAYEIPSKPFEDLISAFEQDQTITRYNDFDQLHDYCKRSADPVGRLVLYLARSANDLNFPLSDSICTGLQLANFWQDVAHDYQKIDRIYLPKSSMDQFGITEADIAKGISTPSFRELLAMEVRRARRFLETGWPLVDNVPKDFRFDISLFIRGGLAILDKIEKHNFAVLESRPKLSKYDFLKLSMQTMWSKRP
jgi:squalene synthase HpnC